MAATMYAAIFVLALVPGLPLGFALFGRRHAAGWIVGAALGYFFTALALWAVIAIGRPSASAFVAAWAIVGVVAWACMRAIGAPLLTPPAWTRRDTLALIVTLLLVPAIAGPPFAHVGATDAQGNRYYRAYFTADFVWHMAVTSEIKKFTMPPRNMFMPQHPLHYYWAYFMLPGSVAGAGPYALANVETDLKVNAIGTAALLTAAIFLLAWVAVPRAWAAASAVALAVLASSAEGLAAVLRILARGAPWSSLRDLNIDAISNWWYGGLRVDGLARCFWWVPQHSMAYILGLAALAIAVASGSGGVMLVPVIAGVALAGSIAFNPFVGALFAVVWGCAVAMDALRSPAPVSRLARAAAAVVPAALGLFWTQANHMTGGAQGLLHFGLLGNARSAPLFNLFLSLGPALVPAAVGAAAAIWSQRSRPLVAPVILIALSLIVMHFVVLSGDDSWVGFRAGQMLLCAAPALIAAGLAATPLGWRRAAIVVATVALLVGLPTTVIDVYNAQDITNLSAGPGFPWTEVVDRDEGQALDWLKRATPATSVVQMDALTRDKTTWSIIPSFAERREAAATPRTLVDDPEYHERSARVRTMYATTSAREAWTIAHELRIDYIWVDQVERNTYPSGMAKFADVQYFAPAFRNDEVVIYHVQ